MNKGEFLNSLRKSLSRLPEEEIDGIIEDYSMHIDELLEEGKTLEEILLTLGSPSKIAQEYLNELGYKEKIESEVSKEVRYSENNYSQYDNKNEKNNGNNLVLFIALQFFNVLFLAGFLIGLIAACGGFIIAGGSVILSSIPVIAFAPGIALKFFTTAMLVGLGVLLFNGGLAGGTSLIKLTIKYIKWNISLIK